MVLDRFAGEWLSGRELDLKSRGCRFKPHQRHCVMSLSKTLFPLLSTSSTHVDPSLQDWKIVDWDVKNQNKQNRSFFKRTSTWNMDIYGIYTKAFHSLHACMLLLLSTFFSILTFSKKRISGPSSSVSNSPHLSFFQTWKKSGLICFIQISKSIYQHFYA